MRFDDTKDIRVTYYTDSEYIRANFQPQSMTITDVAETADILIVESLDGIPTAGLDEHLISINMAEKSFESNVHIPPNAIVPYLRLLDRIWTTPMINIDFSDVKKISKGTLVQFFHLDISDFDCSEAQKRMTEELRFSVDEMGIIFYDSQSNLNALNEELQTLATIFPNSDFLLTQPCRGFDEKKHYIEIFIFAERALQSGGI